MLNTVFRIGVIVSAKKKMDKFEAAPVPEKPRESAAVPQIRNGWSNSRYDTYHTCPAKAKYKFIDKLPEPPADALDRGSLIHKQAENFIKGLPTPKVPMEGPYPRLARDGTMPDGIELIPAGSLPQNLLPFKSTLEDARKRFLVKKLQPTVEDTWAFTKKWEVCSPTDWDNCWLRIKVDYAYEDGKGTLYIVDWKTGKFHADKNAKYMEALQLYALGGMLFKPHITMVKPSLCYLDVGSVYPDEKIDGALEYDRSDIPKLKKLWESRVAPMFLDRVFDPRPSIECGWCPFGKRKGGPCRY